MFDLGLHLTLLIGPTVPAPAPEILSNAIADVSVHFNDRGRSGFQITFVAQRQGVTDIVDFPLLTNPLLKPMNRVVLLLLVNAIPQVLFDGVITNQQLRAGADHEASAITVTGEDVGVMMDLEEKQVEHPAQDETIIANKIIASYATFGLLPQVIPPIAIDIPIPIERVPMQVGSDARYLEEMATRHGYVFYVVPGPLPGANIGYWGPPTRVGLPQPALTVGMGDSANCDGIDFHQDALVPAFVKGVVQDRITNSAMPVQTFAATRIPLSLMPVWLTNMSNTRTQLPLDRGGLNYAQAFGRAQGSTDASTDATITATGSVDTLRYGHVLKARELVGVRGVGFNYDGNYFVKEVTHNIAPGTYSQDFVLTRDGVGPLTPLVLP